MPTRSRPGGIRLVGGNTQDLASAWLDPRSSHWAMKSPLTVMPLSRRASGRAFNRIGNARRNASRPQASGPSWIHEIEAMVSFARVQLVENGGGSVWTIHPACRTSDERVLYSFPN